MKLARRPLALAGLLLLVRPTLAQDDRPLTLLYRDKPPYSYTEDRQPKGLLIEQSRAVLSAAGITAQMEEAPLKRIQLELQASGGKAYLSEHGAGFARRWRESAFVPIVTPSLVQLRTELNRQAREVVA